MGMNTTSAVTAERSRSFRIVVVAAVLIAAVAIGVMFTINASRPQPSRSVPLAATISPSAVAAAVPAPSPSSTAAPSPVALAAKTQFVCGVASTFTPAPSGGLIDAVRTGRHPGYDRLTIQFQGAPNRITLSPQAGTSFTRDGIGDTVKLAGKDGIVVSIFSSDAHTAYTGSTDIKTGFAGMQEVRLVGDYEGYVHWALGLSGPACYHATILTKPTRLVIDFKTS